MKWIRLAVNRRQFKTFLTAKKRHLSRMCGENACGIHKGIGSLGPVILQESFGSDDLKVCVPLSLQGPMQFTAGSSEQHLDIDLTKHKVIASFAELGIGERFGESRVAELIRLDGNWGEISRWLSTDTWKGSLTHPNLQLLRDDEGSKKQAQTPMGHRYSGRPPLTAEQKVACWLHDRGFFHCRHWPVALAAHPELSTANQLAIKWGWLGADGSHPNHTIGQDEIRPEDSPPKTEATASRQRKAKERSVNSLSDLELCTYLREARIHHRWEEASKPDAKTFLAHNLDIHLAPNGFNDLRGRVRRRRSDHHFDLGTLEREHKRREDDHSLGACECNGSHS